MKTVFSGVSIKGIACALPQEIFSLQSLNSLFGEHEVKRIINSTGITSVRIAKDGIRTSDLCISACQKLLKEMNLTGSDIDSIIFVSQTPDQMMPATSVVLQHKLNMSTDSVTFDINYGCSGYIYGLYLACNLLTAGGCKKTLLCAGDVISPYLHPSDKSVRMIFGDGGSATLIERSDNEEEIIFTLKTDGSGAEFLSLKKKSLFMDGFKIMEFALREVPLIIDNILLFKKWSKEEVDIYAFHQPNIFMLNYLRKKMKINKAAIPIAIDGIGNTSSASIPIVLCTNYESILKNRGLNKVVMCGFGAGLSWGACALDLNKTVILRPLEI